MKVSLFSLFVGACVALSGYAQVPESSIIKQSSPELCGQAPGTYIPIPADMAVRIDHSIDQATLSLQVSGATMSIQYPGVVSYIAQVCRLSDGRAVVFGNAYQAMNILILDMKTGAVLDHIDGVHPVMSPDQHWIAFENYYPAHTELPVSSKYRIYDLMKSATKNRAPGTSIEESEYVGTVVFPVVANGDDSAQLHEARLDSFAWAPDSKAVAFEDQVDGNRSVVLVTIENDGTMTPRVFAINARQVCSTPDEVPTNQFIWDSLTLEITGAFPNRSVNVTVKGVKGCSAKLWTIYSQDFKTAEAEQSQPPKKKSVRQDKQ